MKVSDLEKGDIIKFVDGTFEVFSIKKNTGCVGGFLIYHIEKNSCFKFPLLVYENDLKTGLLKIIKLGEL